MFSALFAILFGVTFILTLRNPFWGVVAQMGFILAENTAGPYVPFGAYIIYAINGVTGLSFFFQLTGKWKGRINKIDAIQKTLMVYILYIILTSFHSFFFDSTRNWGSTYFQSLIMVFLLSNSIKSYSEYKRIIVGLLVFGFFSFLTFLLTTTGQIGQIEIEKSNSYGRLLLILIVFCYSLLKSLPAGSKKWSGILLSLILFFAACIMFTNSRTSIIMLGLLIVYFGFQDYKFNFSFITISVTSVLVLLLFLPSGFIDSIFESFLDETYEGGSGTTEYNSITNNIRLVLWEAGFRMLNDDNWFLGIGVGQYKHLSLKYIPILSIPLSYPHNTYISVLVESGIFGFIIFSRILFLSFKQLRKYRFIKNNENRRIMQAWFIAFVIFLIGGLTKHDHYDKLFFLFLGISSSLAAIQEREKSTLSN
jgi:hypothetical protein